MKIFIERHQQGYCIVYPSGSTLIEGKPHQKSTMYFKSKKTAREYATSKGLEV